MAQFYGTVQGDRGETSRLGTQKSGLTVEALGWDTGIKVIAKFNQMTGKDEFYIYLNSGSNGGMYSNLIFEVNTEDADLHSIVTGTYSKVLSHI